MCFGEPPGHCFGLAIVAKNVIRYATKAFGPIMAKAATLTIVEADNIVPVGSIHPDNVDLPGIFVDRVVPSTVAKVIEIEKTRSSEADNVVKPVESAGDIQRNRIAKRAAKELKQSDYVNLGAGECRMRIRLIDANSGGVHAGIPILVPSFVKEGVKVWVQSENGILGMVGRNWRYTQCPIGY